MARIGANTIAEAAAATATTLSTGNAIINGDMAVNQRGNMTGSTNSVSDLANNDTEFCLDRWKIFSDTNDVIDVSQDTTVPSNAGLHSMKLDVETANKKFGVAQAIESFDCQDLIGNEVTLSFQAKVSDASKLDNVKCAIIAWSSTADDLTDDMIAAWGTEDTNPTLASNYTYENTPANLSVTTSFAKYSVTATVDTSSAANIVVFIWSDVTDTTAGHFLFITDVQLEKGDEATAFVREKRHVQQMNCERFYQIFDYNAEMVTVAGDNSTAQAFGNIPLGMGMRTTPTFTEVGTYAFADGANSNSSNPTITIQSSARQDATVTLVKYCTMKWDYDNDRTKGAGYVHISSGTRGNMQYLAEIW